MKLILKNIRIKRISKRTIDDAPESMEKFIADLKAVGASPIDTMKILREKLDIGLGEAKQITFNSDSWRHLESSVNPFTQDFLDQAAKDPNATDVEYENGKVISVKFNLNDVDLKEMEFTMANYWDKFDALCQSVLDKGEQDLYNSLKGAQQYANGLTDGWHDFLDEFEKVIKQYKLSNEDNDVAQSLILTLKKSLDR